VSDRLDRAFRALRETEDGHDVRAEETLARIVRQVERRPVRKSLPAPRVWLLAAAVLAVSTAAAARSGQLGRVLRAFVGTGGGESAPAMSTTHAGGSAALPPPATSFDRELAAPPALSEPPPAVAETPPIEATPAPAPASSRAASESAIAPRLANRPPVRAKRESLASAASAPTTWQGKAAPASSSPSPSESARPSASAAPSPDDHAFARAHALHFHGADPAAALTAWNDYLRAFPAGRFAPEARYNRAIDLLKLGRIAEAREALQPFVDGAFGNYRRDEARAILRSIEAGGRNDGH
jgi:hypothetical protein